MGVSEIHFPSFARVVEALESGRLRSFGLVPPGHEAGARNPVRQPGRSIRPGVCQKECR